MGYLQHAAGTCLTLTFDT
ncbi:Protein of unknown function [Bacillus cereus]|nr:Protein of unknown function [Bacillus cereus]